MFVVLFVEIVGVHYLRMVSGGPFKMKQLASSVSPEANRPKKLNQEGDVYVVCKANIKDDEECIIQ